MNRYFELIQNIISFANRDERIAALIMIGSQARETKSADEFSDLDLILITSDTNWLVNSNDWVSKIGKHYITFVEKTIVSADEKRVMFEGALDVDFVIVSKDDAERVLASKVALEIFQNGYKILVDKTDIKAVIPNSIPLKPYVLPSEEIYINVVNDFWYHTIWTTKKLLRGELWAAKFCLDGYMKYKLLWMIEIYMHAKHGITYNTWFGGRFVDTWAEDEITVHLATAFAHYERQDMIIALKKTMDLFRRIAVQAAEKTKYIYPVESDEYATHWVDRNLI